MENLKNSIPAGQLGMAVSPKKYPDEPKSEPNEPEKNTTQRESTFGEQAVGLTFNPSGDEKVNKAKRLMAEAIDLLNEAENEKTNGGQAMQSWTSNVFKTNAFNKIVDAQMALVKYITFNN